MHGNALLVYDPNTVGWKMANHNEPGGMIPLIPYF